jgi:diguanylate cyclase (GGDEF)-like protein
VVQLEDSARAEACSSALAAAGLHPWRRIEDVPPEARIDVVVTDRVPGAGDAAAPGAHRDAGLITFSEDQGAADVRLSGDASPRELALACQLLAEIVRLRRRIRSASRRRRALSRLALTDALTGLANRRAWEHELAARCLTAREAGQPLCLALLDLDHFKLVNDAYGHMVGDRLLQATGKALQSGLRDYDLVARLGGDEFGVLLTDVTAELAATIVERSRRSVNAALQYASPMPVVASAGYAMAPAAGELAPEALFSAADDALVAAKNGGRNRTMAAG